jgi:hypothetical protein
MTLQDKKKLAELLSKYMNEQMDIDDKNNRIRKEQNYPYEGVIFGTKAKYNHARILFTEVSLAIGKNIVTY